MKLKTSLVYHHNITTCLAYAEELQYLACGSKDSRITVWQIDFKSQELIKDVPTYIIYGHKTEISLIEISDVL
jgi:hypothetical protein